jgi:hypothetical protein
MTTLVPLALGLAVRNERRAVGTHTYIRDSISNGTTGYDVVPVTVPSLGRRSAQIVCLGIVEVEEKLPTLMHGSSHPQPPSKPSDKVTPDWPSSNHLWACVLEPGSLGKCYSGQAGARQLTSTSG